MTPEEAKKIKCDRCGVTISLYRHANGWRCSQCIWNERENLIEWAKNVITSVSKKNIDALKEVVDKVTRISK